MAPTAPGAVPDPIAPSRSGQVQCFGPNFERRTCVSIGSYARDAAGVIQNKAVVLLASTPQIVMTTTAPVVLKGAAICGVIRQRDLDTATFTIDGEPADATDAATLRKTIAPSYVSIMDREVCSVEIPDAEGVVAAVTVDGKRTPKLDLRVRWVSPGDGFVVKP